MKPKLTIPLSQTDLEDLMNGETFDLTFDGVDVHLYMGYDDNDGKDCIKCGNPLKMYWCSKCKCSSESDDKCGECGDDMVVDKNYHDNCS